MKTILFVSLTILTFIFFSINDGIGQTNCEPESVAPVPQGKTGTEIPLPQLGTPEEGVESTLSQEEYRMLYWMHGLNGSSVSWSVADGATVQGVTGFPARKVYTRSPSYAQNQNSFLSASTYLVQNELEIDTNLPGNYDWTDGMVISHSQGGLVTRYMDYYYSQTANHHARKFGGFVTVATSNQGAQIVNNERDFGMLQGLMNETAQELAAGPVSEILDQNSYFFRLFGEAINLEGITESLIDLFVENIGDQIVDLQLPPISNEYRVGSPTITDILNVYEPIVIKNSQEEHTNIVAFYAIKDTLYTQEEYTLENEFASWDKSTLPWTIIREDITLENFPVPISWATIHYFLNPVTDYTVFEGEVAEPETAAKIHLMRLDYEAMVAKYRQGTYLEGLSTPLFIQWKQTEKDKIRGAAWQRGVDMLDKFDRLYRVAIGARVSEEIAPDIFCSCTISGFDFPNGSYFTHYGYTLTPGTQCGEELEEMFPNFTSISCQQWDSDYNFSLRHKDSDGVVLAESAMDIPQATYNNPALLQKDGSTHMRIRNDENTKTLLLEVFTGEVGDFFITEEKH
jgi:hypothetical protein